MVMLFNGIDCSPGRSRIHLGWSRVRRVHIKEFYWCAGCGYIPKRGSNDVHHCIPRHVAPWLADQPFHFLTLCEKYRCHLRKGHWGNFRKLWNPECMNILKDTGKQLNSAELYFLEHVEEEIENWHTEFEKWKLRA